VRSRQPRAWAVPDYTRQQARASAWSPDRAMEGTEEAFGALIPDGLSTANHSSNSVWDGETGCQTGHM